LIPSNGYFLQPALSLARGGTFVTGWDGDGLFATRRWLFLAEVMHGLRMPTARDLGGAMYVALPVPLRRAVQKRRSPALMPWLQPDAETTARSWLVDELAEEPATWSRWIRWYVGTRHQHLVKKSYDALGTDHDAVVHHFFMEPAFLAALARRGPIRSPGDRTKIMKWLFDDVLPEKVLDRSDKGMFLSQQWGSRSMKFAANWDGSHVDPDIVRMDVLKDLWNWGIPVGETVLLLQDVWLRSRADHVDQSL
jgi:asparagine synthase (glutamine-hydrolysing)